MIKTAAALLALFTAGMGAIAQTPAAATSSAQTAPKHYRLTFVLTYPDGKQPAQTLVLDIPVLPDRPGMSGMNLNSGLTGQDENSVQESLRCTDVRESATGLAASVGFTMESVLPPPANFTEPVHRQLNFEQKFDIALGKPTRITQEMHRRPLKPGDEKLMGPPPAAPQITVTAVEI